MNDRLLKAILGKFICKTRPVCYCHVDRVLSVEEPKAIVTAIVETPNKRVLHWILETSWDTDPYGVYSIKNYKILKEDELNEYPA